MRWYDWHQPLERIRAFGNVVMGGNKGFRILFDDTLPDIALTMYTPEKAIIINPIKVGETDEEQYFISKAEMAHEALHVKYTDSNCINQLCQDLGWLINLLEDIRIDSIGSHEMYECKRLLALKNKFIVKRLPVIKDILKGTNGPDDPKRVLNALLPYKFGLKVKANKIMNKDLQKKWKTIHGWLESLTGYPDTTSVAILAKKILDLLGLNQETDYLYKASMSLEPYSGKSQGKNNNAQTNFKKFGVNNDKTDNDDDTDQPDNQEDSNSSFDCSMLGDGQDQEQGTDETTPDDEDEEQSEEDIEVPNTTKEDSSKENNPQEETKKNEFDDEPKETDGEKDESDDVTDEENIDDIFEDEENIHSGSSHTSAEFSVPETKRFDKRRAPYNNLRDEALPIVQQIVNKMQFPMPKTKDLESDEGSRFHVKNFLRNPEKPFSQKLGSKRKPPSMAVHLVLDRSVSMGDCQRDLKLAAMTIYLACEELKIPIAITALEGTEVLKEFDVSAEDTLALIAGLEIKGCTHVTSTMKFVEKVTKNRKEEIKQVLFIHDGSPDSDDIDPFVDWINAQKNMDVIGLYTAKASFGVINQLQGIFGERNLIACPLGEVPNAWANIVKNVKMSRY